METIFKFKQFEVDQKDCAMKINTDGVILGAILNYEHPNRILDIGAGTGVISLMLAQRFEEAFVDAVEIEPSAYHRSVYNFKASKFSSRLHCYFGSFEDLSVPHKYDLIVSNPPFFTNSLHNPNEKKKIARHTDLDFFSRLLSFSLLHLSDSGSLQLILPYDLAIEVIEMANSIGLFLFQAIDIRSFEDSVVIRQIIDLRKCNTSDVQGQDLTIYKSKGEYTDIYKQLLAPFFLAY